MRLKHGWHVMILLAAIFGGKAADAAPRQVVSTFLCTDEYVFRLLPRDRIAALSFLATDPSSNIADKVKGIRLIRGGSEEVLPLRPDLVVMYQGTNPKLKAHLDETHTPYLEVAWANSLADIRDVTRKLSAALGVSARGEAMIAEMDMKLARAAKDAPRPPVPTLIYEPNGYANSGGVTDAILSDAGLVNVAARMHQTRQSTVPVEEVIAHPPALLLLNAEAHAAPSRGDLILKHPALHALPKSTLVANTSLTPLLCPGPWSADAAEPLAALGRKARTSELNK